MTNCFGGMEATKQVESNTKQTTSPPDWVKAAGKSNYDLASSILKQGFQPYTGEMVAPLSQNEQQASQLVSTAAGTSNPYSATAAADYTGYGAAPAYNFDFNTVVDPNSKLGTVGSYMDPYLAAVLDPTLRQIGVSGAQARQGINANATSAGAYGDARHGVVESEQFKNQAQQEQDAVAQGYSGAYNTAMGLREQDLARLFGTQQAQQGANETALNRMRQSGIDLTGLDQYDTGRALSLANALGQTGATERGVQNQQDAANMSEFMRKNNFTDDQVAFLTSILAGTPTEKTTTGVGTQVTSQPNNSGWQAVGNIATAILGSI